MLSTSFASSGSEFQAVIVAGKNEFWYKKVLDRAPSKWDELRNDLVDEFYIHTFLKNMRRFTLL